MPIELVPAAISGAQTITQQIYTGPCGITCLGVFTNGADDFQITIWDSLSAAGKRIWATKVKGADHYGGRLWIPSGGMDIGIHAVVDGLNGWFVVENIKKQ